jgi:putative tricarboxylic transport membrane protein
MDTRAGDPHVVSISHPNLTTDRLVGIASFDYTAYTPIAILYTEYIAFVVRADSWVKTPVDLLERLRASASSMTVALSTALGNPNHIAFARVVQHAGGEPGTPLVRVFDSALDAIADVVAGKSEVGAVTAASVASALAARQVRVIAVSAPRRLGGGFADVPTWIEQSVDCVVGAWRGLAGAAGIGESQITFWERLLEAAIATDEWRNALYTQSWAPSYITGIALRRFLEDEREQMAAMLNELGLLRLDAAYSGRKTTERDV